MKLLDIISEERIITPKIVLVEDETPDTRRPPRGTEITHNGRRYRFLGQMWAPLNADGTRGSTGSVSSRLQQTLSGQWRTSNPVSATPAPATPPAQTRNFRPVANVFETPATRNGTSRGILTYVDSNGATRGYTFDNVADAREAATRFNNAGGTDIDGWERENTRRYQSSVRPYQKANILQRLRFQRDITAQNLQQRNNRWITKILGNTWIQMLAVDAWIIYSAANNAQDIEEAVAAGELTAEEGEEALNMVYSTALAMFVADLVALYIAGKVVRFLRLARSAWRAITLVQVAAAPATLGGSLLTAGLSFILGEVAFFAARIILTSSGAQEALAELISNSIFGDIFEFIGSGLRGAHALLRQAASSLVGGPAISDALFQADPAQAPTGLAYASSQWAREVFAFTIHGKKGKVLVPYTAVGSRLEQIIDTLGLDEANEGVELGTPERPRPVPSGQAGMISDYVFAFSDEEYQRLRNTHDVIVLNDVGGRRPGTANQILLLAPQPSVLASGQSIPQPDNRVITRTGQLIERPAQAPAPEGTVDIEAVANAAINAS